MPSASLKDCQMRYFLFSQTLLPVLIKMNVLGSSAHITLVRSALETKTWPEIIPTIVVNIL